MKAMVPRDFASLLSSSRKQIEKLYEDQYQKDMNVILDIYMKMSCVILHSAFGFGEKRLNAYLGNYRQFFRRQVKNVKAGNQIEELDREMRAIFRKNGYPDEFFKTMFADWEVKTDAADS